LFSDAETMRKDYARIKNKNKKEQKWGKNPIIRIPITTLQNHTQT